MWGQQTRGHTPPARFVPTGQLSTLPSAGRSRCQRPFTEIGIISRSSTPRPGSARPELSFQFLQQSLGAEPAGSLLWGGLLMCTGYRGHGAR